MVEVESASPPFPWSRGGPDLTPLVGESPIILVGTPAHLIGS
jgi:hypothetical protein